MRQAKEAKMNRITFLRNRALPMEAPLMFPDDNTSKGMFQTVHTQSGCGMGGGGAICAIGTR